MRMVISSPICFLSQVTGKRCEGKGAGEHLSGAFSKSVYEAAVNQEKQDARRSHKDLIPEENENNTQEEITVVVLNVSFYSTSYALYSIKNTEHSTHLPMLDCF